MGSNSPSRNRSTSYTFYKIMLPQQRTDDCFILFFTIFKVLNAESVDPDCHVLKHFYVSGACCSKLATSLVNVSLKFKLNTLQNI